MKRTRRNNLDNEGLELGNDEEEKKELNKSNKKSKKSDTKSNSIIASNNDTQILTLTGAGVGNAKSNIHSELIIKENFIKNDSISNSFFCNEDIKKIIEVIKLHINDQYAKRPEFNNNFLLTNTNKSSSSNNNTNFQSLSKLEKIAKYKIISPIEIFYKIKYEEFHKLSLEEDKCTICQFHFYEENLRSKSVDDILKINCDSEIPILLFNCTDHFFHLECLNQLIGDKSHIKCPNCNKIYGAITGDQPKGTMTARATSEYSCQGYSDSSTIEIEYKFPNGKGYTGTYRIAYLPNNKEGREVLALFKVAFDRKLLFTLGTSVTTGQENTTIWNGVHQKTNISGGSQNYGYPDLTYFNRVRQELASKGVLEENAEESLESIADKFILREENKKSRKKIDK